MKDAGATILMSTHYMEEAAALCDRLIIMDLGRILASGTPDELIVEHAGMEMGLVRPNPGARESVLAQVERRGLDYMDRGAALAVATNGNGRGDFAGIEDAVVTFRPANLEDVFLKLTGRRLREE
jgi:lipooligosaccharide transport system ATP-binding protein